MTHDRAKQIRAKVLATAVTSLALLASACGERKEARSASAADAPAAASSGGGQLKIARRGSQASRQGPAESFTGSVRVDPLFQANAPSRTSGAYVTFEPGARSAWHTHPVGQVLIVTAGTGRVQRWGDPLEEIREGDVVSIPPGQKHWHGASPESAMTHIAVLEHLDGKTTDWMEKVTDEQYGAPAIQVAKEVLQEK